MALSLLVGLSFASPGAAVGPVPPGANLPGWQLVWHDEFSGPYGAAVDRTRWNFDVGGSGWGNGELQYYTDTRRNAAMDGSGRLVITARAEPETTQLRCSGGLRCRYTSARLTTKGKFEGQYGRVEARIRVAGGQGLWSAFWMLGANFPGTPWPASGEIDIMENIGREPGAVHGTLHGPGYSGGAAIGKAHSLVNGGRFQDDFHVYAVQWAPGQIRWSVDGLAYQTRSPADVPDGQPWVYEHPFFVILNLAVGGGWPGYPDGTSLFPASMLVDYVRAYQKIQ